MKSEINRKTPAKNICYSNGAEVETLVFNRPRRACVVSNQCPDFRRKRLVADILDSPWSSCALWENGKNGGTPRGTRLISEW